jgi:hypothetical protein
LRLIIDNELSIEKLPNPVGKKKRGKKRNTKATDVGTLPL